MDKQKYERAKQLSDSFDQKLHDFRLRRDTIADLMTKLCPGSDPWSGNIYSDVYMTLRREYMQADASCMIYLKAWICACDLRRHALDWYD